MLVCGFHTSRLIQSRSVRKGQRQISATSDVNITGTNVRAASHWTDLKDPYHIFASGNKSVKVKVSIFQKSLDHLRC